MKVLVTGASGFLGSHVAEGLVKRGDSVRVLVRKTSNKKFLDTLGVEYAYGAIEDVAAVEAAVKGVDAIVHSAGIVKARNAAELAATNVGGTKNVLAAAKKHCPALKRFVHVSSLEASGPSKDGEPIAVDQESPCTEYGRSKLLAEKACLAFKDDLAVTILRPTAIYGPRDVEILEAFRSVKRRMLPITGDGSVRYTFVYGPDCAAACIAAIDADVPSGSTFFVADGDVWQQKDMMAKMEEAIGTRAFVRKGIPFGVVKAAAFFVEAYGKATNKAVMLTREKASMLEQHFVCDPVATKKALGWEPQVKWEEGAKLTARWYEENGWL